MTTPTKPDFDITDRALLALLRAAVFGGTPALPEGVDFSAVLDRAEAHTVFGVLSEGLSLLPENAVGEKELFRLQDLTVVLLRRNETLAGYRRALCDFLAEKGIPAVIFKGDAVARRYPAPELRVAGDIDILLYEKDIPAAADFLLSKGFQKVEAEGEHHDAYARGGYEIELHRRVSGIPKGEMGEVAKEMLQDTLKTAKTATVLGDMIPVADDDHEALILLLHMQQHMREGGLGLRQVMDFMLFLRDAHLTAKGLQNLEKLGLARFAAVVEEACVRYLGLPPEGLPFPPVAGDLPLRLFSDFLKSGNFGRGDKSYSGSGVVTLERTAGEGAFRTALKGVSRKCRRQWPAADKFPPLLLFLVPFWVVRRLLKKGGVKPVQMMKEAGKRGEIYDELHLFEKEK